MSWWGWLLISLALGEGRRRDHQARGECVRDHFCRAPERFQPLRRRAADACFATIGPATDLGIIVAAFNEKGGYTLRPEGPAIRAGDIIEALRMSTHLADLASVLASEKL